MNKLFCDWCGKEINHNRSARVHFPALVIPYMNGKPCGEVEIDREHPHSISYDVCLDCIRKIWSLRHDQA